MFHLAIATLSTIAVACGPSPAGGLLPVDAQAVNVAREWARGLQATDRPRVLAVMNPLRYNGLEGGGADGYPQTLVAAFARCGAEEPDTFGLLTDPTEGHERYMIVGRYSSACLSVGGTELDSFTVYELTVDGSPKVDRWSFGRPPGL
jgi:hypothetical protein